MKERSGILKWIIIGLIVLAAIFTCPDQRDHRKAIQQEMMDEADQPDGTSEAIANALGGLFVGAVLDGTLQVKNYLVFSVGKINNPFNGESKTVSWGLFGHVFVRDIDD